MASIQLGDYSSDPKARQGDGVLCLQVHGDASLAGQVQYIANWKFPLEQH